jgi:hypothetical protein
MKNAFMTFVILLSSISALAAPKEKTTIDDTRAASGDIVEITIEGGKGSQAEKLYNSLSKVEEQPDNGMGGRHGTAKQGKAIDCSVENDAFASHAYQCIVKVTTGGDSLEPWK